MKNLKKVIALIAVLALTLSTVALGATYTDVAEDSAYSVAVESLSKLGIVTGYEDGTYGPEKAVTRAEMAALIARIQGYEETASAQTATVFADVPASHWASGYVAAASNMGIVNGYGDGTFGPEDSVKYEQAVTMIMRTLGYEPFAAANGGYPTGYLAAAQRYGLTKNVSNAVSGTDANRGTIAQLLYNGIDTPIMAQSKWGTDGDIEYTIYDGVGRAYKTLMSENLGVVKVKGIVLENSVAAINGSKDIDTSVDAEVLVDIIDLYDTTNKDAANWNMSSQAFLAGDSDIADFLGYRTIFYVMEDEATDKYVVISAAKDSTTNATVEFTLDQYAGLTTKNGKEYVQYYKNDTDKEPTDLLVDGAAAVLNYAHKGAVSSVFDVAPITANTTYGGKVTLIDNDTTNGYDVAFVEYGVSAVVQKSAEDKVTFKKSIAGIGKSIVVDLDNESQIIELTKDGVAIAPADLVEWDVVTFVWNGSESEKYIKAEVVGTTVTGTVASTKSSDTSVGGSAFKIEGNYYDVANGAFEADVEIGDGGIFYIDKYGKIVAFNEDPTLVGRSAGTYAYVLEADENKTFGVYRGQARLLTANGVDIYDFADEVEVNGVDTDMEDATQGNVAGIVSGFLNTMIKYNVNSNGEIDAIDTAGANLDDYEFMVVGSANTSASWDADNINLNGPVDEDAVLFLLSTTNVKTESKVGTIADLEDGENYTFTKFVDKKGDDCNLILVTSGFGSAGVSSNIAVITEVSYEVNDANEDVLVLNYYQDGELKERVYTSETVYNNFKSSLTAGDIVKVKLTDGVVTGLTSKVNFNEDVRDSISSKVYTTQQDGNNNEEEYVFDIASNFKDTTTSITVSDFGSVRLSKAVNTYVVDANGRSTSIEVGDDSDFAWDEDIVGANASHQDYVFLRTYKGSLIDVVIIKSTDEVTSAEKATILAKKAELAAEIAKKDKATAAIADVAAAVTAASLTDASTVQAVVDALVLLDTDEATAAKEALVAAATLANITGYDATVNTAAEVDAALDAIVSAATSAISTLNSAIGAL